VIKQLSNSPIRDVSSETLDVVNGEVIVRGKAGWGRGARQRLTSDVPQAIRAEAEWYRVRCSLSSRGGPERSMLKKRPSWCGTGRVRGASRHGRGVHREKD
jgi:hypothetical protein